MSVNGPGSEKFMDRISLRGTNLDVLSSFDLTTTTACDDECKTERESKNEYETERGSRERWAYTGLIGCSLKLTVAITSRCWSYR